MTKKQKPKRTVASFLSDRLKQQVTEQYDYLEENTRRIHSVDTEGLSVDYARESHNEKITLVDSEKDMKQPSRALSGASSGFSRNAIDSPSPSSLVSSVVQELAMALTLPHVDEIRDSEEVEVSSGAGQLNKTIQEDKTPENFSEPTSEIFPVVETRDIKDELVEEILAGNRDKTVDLFFQEQDKVLQQQGLQGKIPHSFDFQKETLTNLISVESEPKKKPINQTQVSTTLASDLDFTGAIPLPNKLLELMVRGGISLRGIQIYLAMLSEAGFKVGGIATFI